VRLGWVWLGLIHVIALLTGGLHIFAFPLVIAAWFIYACAAALIGLWYSMVSRSALRATVLSVLTCVALGVGHWLVWLCCVPLFLLSGSGGGDGPFYLAKFQAGMTPPAALFVMAFQGEELRGNMDGSLWVELMAFSLFGLFLTSLASLFFWNGVLVPKFRVLTGRDEERTSDNTPRGPELPAPARAPSGAALDAAAPAAGAPDAAISNLTVEAGDGHP